MKISSRGTAPVVLLLLLLGSCSTTTHHARPGDPLLADYTCRLADGSLVETTIARIAGDDSAVKSPLFSLRDRYLPIKFTVTDTPEQIQGKPFDPLEQKISLAIAERAKQIPLEQTTRMELPNRQIDNIPPGDRFLKMAAKLTQPRTREMPLKEFEVRYGSITPVKGSVVGKDTDFPGIIRAISDDSVTLYFSARQGAKMPMALGTASVRAVDKDNFEATMDVHEGQLIPRIGGLPGRVTAIDEQEVTVDFGQSFAGETLYCEVTARPFDPAQAAKPVPIDWIEDFDKGLALARQQGKPVVLFLYSDGCPYCHQMENKVFPDPSLEQFRSSFVWLKINSEKQTEYGERFKQQGYPLTLVLDGVGGEQERFSGLQHVTTLAYKLDHILSPKKKG